MNAVIGQRFYSDNFGRTFAGYVGYDIQLSQVTQYQVAMKGFDAELGGALPRVGDYVRAYLGVYNFQGEGSPQAWGWKTRLASQVTDRMRFYLTAADVAGQNAITGTVVLQNTGSGSTTAVAPNSLPIPQ